LATVIQISALATATQVDSNDAIVINKLSNDGSDTWTTKQVTLWNWVDETAAMTRLGDLKNVNSGVNGASEGNVLLFNGVEWAAGNIPGTATKGTVTLVAPGDGIKTVPVAGIDEIGTVSVDDTVFRTVGVQSITGDTSLYGNFVIDGSITASGTLIIPIISGVSSLSVVNLVVSNSISVNNIVNVDTLDVQNLDATNITNVSTFQTDAVDCNGTITGVTIGEDGITTFYGDGSNLTGIDAAKPLRFRSDVAVAVSQAPDSSSVPPLEGGDFCINIITGDAGSSWVGLQGQTIIANQMVYYSSTLTAWVAGGVQDNSLYLPVTGGTLTGALYAPNFVGSLEGTADNATNALAADIATTASHSSTSTTAANVEVNPDTTIGSLYPTFVDNASSDAIRINTDLSYNPGISALSLTGSITATTFHGDGSALTGVVATTDSWSGGNVFNDISVRPSADVPPQVEITTSGNVAIGGYFTTESNTIVAPIASSSVKFSNKVLNNITGNRENSYVLTGDGTIRIGGNIDTDTLTGQLTTIGADGTASFGGAIAVGGQVTSSSLTTGTSTFTGAMGGVGATFSGDVTANKFTGEFEGDGSLITDVPMVPAGNDTEVQFNNSGAVAGSGNLTYNGDKLSANGVDVPQGQLYINGTAYLGSAAMLNQMNGSVQGEVKPYKVVSVDSGSSVSGFNNLGYNTLTGVNYADAAAAGAGTAGQIAVIGGALCFHDGTSWKTVTLGAAPA